MMKEKQERAPRRFPSFLLKKKVLIPLCCCLLAAGGITVATLIFFQKTADSVCISQGLQQLANETYLAASAPLGESVSFTAEWFDNAIGGSQVSAITLTELPPPTQGVLYLGHGEVQVGQTIPRDTLSYLRFSPNEGVKQSCFSFAPTTKDGLCGYALLCNLTLTAGTNCCPTGKGPVVAVSTHETLTLHGKLEAEDPDGDRLYFEVCSYPKNGVLSLDRDTGRFSYDPKAGFCGADSFTWRAQDENGGYSETATVQIKVRDLTTGYTFSDISDNTIHSAALRVTAAGLLGGEEVSGKHYFHPEHELSRAAFVSILLKAAEINVPEATETGFADDSEIPEGMKGAIRYAKEQGWLGEESTFRPNAPITRAEAAQIAAKVLGLSAPGYAETVQDFTAIPVDVADAIYALFEGGYIATLADGRLAPTAVMTKEDAAKFFARILDGKEAE